MFDVTKLPIKKQFTKRLIKPDTWIINPWNENNSAPHPHIVIGEEKALLIDATNTTLPLREYIEEYVTDKPLMVASTHSHGDHTNANWMFEDLPIFMSEFAWNEIQERRKMDPVTAKWGKNKPGNYVPTLLKPGDIIDLGNRIIEVIPYEGSHSLGSLFYLDHKYGVLFPGDEIECGQMLVMGKRSDVNCIERLRDNLQKLIDDWGDQITTLCPPHNGSPIDAKFLEYLVENCERIMSGIEGDQDVGSTSYLYNPLEGRSQEKIRAVIDNPMIKRSEWMGTSIIYSEDRIFKNQIK